MRNLMSAVFFCLLTPAVQAQTLRVMTDIPPVHALVSSVMGDLGTSDLLLGKGADTHDFQLRPSQAQALTEADLIIWVGPELTSWLDRALTGLEAKAPQLRLLAVPGTALQPYGDADGQDHDHGHDHGDDHGDDHGLEDAKDSADIDPHAWLDPHNALLWLDAIAAELAKADPANAAIYAANARSAQAEVTALEAEIAATLAPVQDRPFAVFHDAYGYFSGHFGLKVVGSVRLGDATSPGAAHLAALGQELSAQKALCLFPEVNHDAALARALTEGSGLRLGAPLDPEGIAIEPGAGLYATLMRNLARDLAACLEAS
jgi:zinc transport system substrate-binding protein